MKHRIRVWFTKEGDARFISHLDLMRLFGRAIRRARLPVRWSSGFNPRPKMAFPLALGVGVTGTRELMELDLEEPIAEAALARALAGQLPGGVRIRLVEALGPTERARVVAVTYQIDLPPGAAVEADRVADLLGQSRLEAVRGRDGIKRVNIRPYVEALHVDGAARGRRLSVTFGVTPQGTGSPKDILRLLGVATTPGAPAPDVTRTEIRLASSPSREAPSRPEGEEKG